MEPREPAPEKRPETSTPGERASPDVLFGEIAIDCGILTRTQLDLALREQREGRDRGQDLPLGEILVRRDRLTADDLLKILLEQGRRLARTTPSLPRYEIRERLGEGATSIVYDGWDRDLGRAVAVKVLKESSRQSATARERFQREAQAAASIDHPNVVRVYDFGEREGQFYIVMEKVRGWPLSTFFRGGPVPERELARVMQRVALGTFAAHEKKIVHRDLKPGNIMLTPEGEPKVADFGLAHVSDLSRELTRTGASLGTPAYMAPEQVHGAKGYISPMTDVYSLGVILYQGLTGRLPHEGETIGEVYARIVQEDPPRPRTLNPQISVEMETIILKAMDKHPVRRYADAAELAADLARYLEGEAVRARRTPWPVLAARGVRRHPWLTLAATLLVLAAGFAVYVAAGRQVSAALLARWAADAGKAGAEGRWQDALAGYERALALAPGNDVLRGRKEEAARRIAEEKDRLTFQKERAEAAVVYKEFAREMHMLRLRSYQPGWRLTDREFAEFERIARDAEAQMAKTGPAGDGWWVVGRVRQILGNAGPALEAYERGAETEPGHGLCLVYKARLLLDQALIAFAMAPAEQRNSPEPDPSLKAAAALLERGMNATGMPELEQDLARGYELIIRGQSVRDYAEGMLRKWEGRDFCEEFSLLRGLGAARELLGKPAAALLIPSRPGPGGNLAASATEAIRTRACFYEAWFWRGLYREFTLDRAGALADLDRALEIHPRFVEAYVFRGYVHLRARNWTAAERDLSRAIELHPRLAPAFLWRGRAREASGDPAAALADYTSAVDLHPRDLLARTSRGLLRSSQGDAKGAVEDLDQAIEINPRHGKAWSDRGTVRHLTLGDLDGALQDFDHALRILPRDAGLWCRRGDLRRDRGDFLLAIDDYSASARLNPRGAEAVLGRGRARQALAAAGSAGPRELLALAAADFESVLKLADASWYGRSATEAYLREARERLASAPE